MGLEGLELLLMLCDTAVECTLAALATLYPMIATAVILWVSSVTVDVREDEALADVCVNFWSDVRADW